MNKEAGVALPALSWMCQQHSPQGERHGRFGPQEGVLPALPSCARRSGGALSTRIRRCLQHRANRRSCSHSSRAISAPGRVYRCGSEIMATCSACRSSRDGHDRTGTPGASSPTNATRVRSDSRGSGEAAGAGERASTLTMAEHSSAVRMSSQRRSMATGSVSAAAAERSASTWLAKCMTLSRSKSRSGIAQQPSTGTIRLMSGSCSSAAAATWLSRVSCASCLWRSASSTWFERTSAVRIWAAVRFFLGGWAAALRGMAQHPSTATMRSASGSRDASRAMKKSGINT